jgi:mono/diheme cytochrome c family protein
MKSATSSFRRALFSAAAILLATVAATEIFQSLSAQTPDFHGAPASAAAIENPHTGVQDLEAGQAVFKQNCAVCHGPVGQGTGNIPSLAKGPAQSAKAGELFWFITKGDPTNAMPSWAQLAEEQRWQVVTFLQHLPSGSAAAAALAPEAANRQAFVGPPSRPPFTDFRVEKPGVVRKITVADLPAPFASQSAGNAPRVVPRPEGVWPQALPGFKVELYASDLENPRLIRTAPNGDYFLAETAKGRIIVFRGITAEGKPEITSIFASGLHQPFGIAFYPKGPNPQWVYIGDTDAVVRFPYKNGEPDGKRSTGAYGRPPQ